MKSNLATVFRGRVRASGALRLLLRCAATVAFFVPLSLWGGESMKVWRVDKYEDGIKVSSREIHDSATREVKAEVDINAPFEKAFALLLDTGQRPRWDKVCTEASVYKKLSESEDIIYVVNDLPWPVSDRDMLLRRQWSVAPDGSQARILSHADNTIPSIVDDRVRVEKAEGTWTLVRTGSSSVRLSTVIHAEPGGPIPGWLINALSVNGPYNALHSLRQILESENQALAASGDNYKNRNSQHRYHVGQPEEAE
ncbi:START domain-containing protein [Spongiibacter sp. UBA1325]|uniref:START domain-containing protein n=1 Tax=Spongiibacter sp. UBA1325 TaxID=1947543 RepID=UPI00257A142B|nr:START domain-containing protein [Spongiibacter sp. UBA1325]|tara:strand:+ start:13076 stop:13837 length:762 start_codon:yes stop_codon:yes gene_type:complete